MAWDAEEKHFVKSRHLNDPYTMPVIPTRNGFKLYSNFELFMFTGEKDTAGREIYEGHILELSLHPHLDRVFVSFEDGAFRVSIDDEVKNLADVLSYWNKMDGTVSIVGHIKTHEV